MSGAFNRRWAENWTTNPHLQADFNAMVAAGMSPDQVAAAVGAPSARVLRTYTGWRRRKGDDFACFPKRFIPRGPAKSAVPTKSAVVATGFADAAAEKGRKKPLCLKCRRSFERAYKGNFICPTCTRNNRKQGLDLYGGLF